MHDTSRNGTSTAMNRVPVIILGIPFDNLTLDEATEYIFDLMDRSYSDRKSRLVCMADMDCIADALRGNPRKMRHLEFLSILRRADMVTAGHMPAVRMSKFLGPALKECIMSGDLVSCIAREALRRGKSVYILGSGAESVKHSSFMLQDRFPGLRMAGGATLAVYSEGAEPVDEYASDAVIVDKINASSADILFISLGSPNQEIWFERNRDRLQIPVCICVGDIFVSIARSELCTPAWTHGAGLENLFHSKRDKGYMKKYSLIKLIKFWLLILPSVLVHQYSKTVTPQSYLKMSKGKIFYRYWTRGAKEFFSLTLPEIIDSETARRLSTLIPKKSDSHLVLDFSPVKFIDSAGLGFLLNLIHLWDTDKYEVLHVGLSRYMKKILSYNRMHGLIPSRPFSSQDEVLAYLDAKIEE
jgi:N-acetylglucosaminyldiphosphoundecaprenol N-acetyl-beta-D-mannosaminyltransferase